MNKKENLSCIDCFTTACKDGKGMRPDFCVGEKLSDDIKQQALSAYQQDEQSKKVAVVAAEIEGAFYGKMTRVEETCEFAKKIGAKKIGIALCVGLIEEGRIFAKFMRGRGFEVYGACCKAGSFPKPEFGIEEQYIRRDGECICNPVLQAKILNEQKTDLNVVIGLCVGHDSLFYKYSDALCTTLVAKDRVLGHNPVAALYTAKSYYKKLFTE